MRKQYPIAYNPILEYWEAIQTEEVVVGFKVRRIYQKLVDDIFDDSSVWEYSPKRANHAIEFIENYCRHSKGKWGGKPIDLELWQKAFLAATFGFIHKMDGTRKHREVFLIVGRKNGKSTIASGVGLYLMIADSEPGPEVYAVATKKDQAKIVWLEAKRMVKKSPTLLKRVKPLVSTLVSDWNDSMFMPLGSDSDTLDGLNVHGAIMDEPHAWKGKELYDVIVDGGQSREQPLYMMISTAGFIREGIYDIKYDEAERYINGIGANEEFVDERFLPIVYELDNRSEWTEARYWPKANPGLGTIKKMDELERKVNKAQTNAMLVPNLLTKDFNMRQNSSEAWLTFEQINNTETFDLLALKPKYGIGGADLSITTDLTAAKVIFMVPGDVKVYALSMYWLPEDLLEQRTKEDKIPYDVWLQQGLIRTTPGNTIHPKYVTDWFLEIRDHYKLYLPWIGYDSYSARYWVEEMKGNFGGDALIEVKQGKPTLSGPMHLLGADLDAKRVVYNNNPIDKWCLSNTVADVDRNGNIQPIKSKNQRRRIDGTAALLNAYVILQKNLQSYMNMI